MGRTTHRPSVWCSKHYFFFIISYRLRALKTLYFYYKKINWNDFCKEFCYKLWKKIILGTSDAWSMSYSSQRPSKPAYCIEDCRIFAGVFESEPFYFMCFMCLVQVWKLICVTENNPSMNFLHTFHLLEMLYQHSYFGLINYYNKCLITWKKRCQHNC